MNTMFFLCSTTIYSKITQVRIFLDFCIYLESGRNYLKAQK